VSARYPRVHRVGPLARGVTIARQYLHRGRAVTMTPVGAVLRRHGPLLPRDEHQHRLLREG
jgi:hypothetical protein